MNYILWISVGNTTEITILDAYKVLISTYKFLTYPSTTDPTYVFTQFYMHIPSCKKCGLQMHTPAFGSADSPVSKSFLLEMWARVPVQLIHVPVKAYPVSSHTRS